MLRVPVEHDTVAETLLQRVPKTIPQHADARHRLQIAGERTGRTEANREQGAFGAGAPAMFMPGAMDQRLEPDPASDIERPDTLWCIEFVAGDGQQIDAKRVDLACNLADRLRCVGVKPDPTFPRNSTDLLDRLDRANLIVGVHDADQDGARRDGTTHVVGIDPARAVDRHIGHCRAEPARGNGKAREWPGARP